MGRIGHHGAGEGHRPGYGARVAALMTALVLAGCAASPASVSPGGSPSAGPTSTASPSVSAAPASSTPLATLVPSAGPTVTPGPTATPPFPPPAGWSVPRPVGAATACSSVTSPVVVVIDGQGGYHLASGCDGKIHYAVSGDGGKTWTETVLQPPADRGELGPQLAVDGNTLYLAYTRVAPDEGCGSNGTKDVGVWYRTRSLPSGAWSAPTQLGQTNDHIDGLRVVAGTIHALVESGGDYSSPAYETQAGATYHRYPLAAGYAVAPASLRVGDDGKARIAYESDTSLRYGVFNGSTFTTSAISGSGEGWAPVLVLGQGNAAYLLWNRRPEPGGCVTRDLESADGTYFGTNASGVWQTSRLTTVIGDTSLTLDVASGRLHALLSGDAPTIGSDGIANYSVGRLIYYTKAAGGSWTHTTLLPYAVTSPVIRLDPASGALLVAYIVVASDGASAQALVMTRP